MPSAAAASPQIGRTDWASPMAPAPASHRDSLHGVWVPALHAGLCHHRCTPLPMARRATGDGDAAARAAPAAAEPPCRRVRAASLFAGYAANGTSTTPPESPSLVKGRNLYLLASNPSRPAGRPPYMSTAAPLGHTPYLAGGQRVRGAAPGDFSTILRPF